MRILYLAHDLDDTAIWRRADMLRRGGAKVVLAGFRRLEGPLPGDAVVLGQTANGRMMQRVKSVLGQLAGIGKTCAAAGPHDLILARNLEMLALGARAKAAFPKVPLVYELLDVHRLLSGRGVISAALRGIERLCLRNAQGVIYSSDGFRRGHPSVFAQSHLSQRLIENKPLAQGTTAPPLLAPTARQVTGPLVIGWNGILRCRWSLEVLDQVTRRLPGHIRVILRGRPALDQLPEFHAVIAANPDLTFAGPYRAPEDLAAIYGQVDLAWLIDRYEAGGNSDWLLPNRLYEGCLHGAVPVVLEGTEVARRVALLGVGLPINAADATAVFQTLAALDKSALAVHRLAVQALPRKTWEADETECRALVGWLSGLSGLRGGQAVVTAGVRA